MPTKKTNTKSPTHAERVAASHAELADATTQRDTCRADLDTAQESVATIRQGQRAGDVSQSIEEAASALLSARARVTVCEDRLTHAEQRHARALRNLLSDDISVAKPVAAAVAGLAAFAEYDVKATAEPPTIPDTIARPVLYLWQTEAAVHDPFTGRSSAPVEMHLHRPTWGLPLDTDELPEALSRSEVFADVHPLGKQERGAVHVDLARLSVRAVWLPVPVIGTPNGAEIFGQTIAGRVADHLDSGIVVRQSGVMTASGIGSTTALGRVAAGQGNGKIISETDTGGERLTTVETTLTLRAPSLPWSQVVQGADAYMRGRVGGCESGLGRVRSVEPVRDQGNRSGDKAVSLSYRFVFGSARA